MPHHEFIIYKKKPSFFTRFISKLNNNKYSRIIIDDDIIKNISFSHIPTYYNYFRKKYKSTNLNYYGITLIPPSSLNNFVKILKSQNKNNLVFNDLIKMAKLAKENNYYIIHFGI